MMKGIWVVAAAALVLGTAAAHADELLIETIQADQQAGAERPQRGMSMDRVREAFGTPDNRSAAVGDPPITSWQYQGFTVYFEHDRVIHTVAR